jgi:SNF family Na+-dependent transporter
MSFWDVVWFIVISFAFIAYLMVMFSIIADLFRDRDTSGVVKAVWIIGLIVFPFLVALIYLIVKGNGMAERSARSAESMRRQQDDYIKSVAGHQASPAEQIEKAREMLEAGTISQAEFEQLKAKALV